MTDDISNKFTKTDDPKRQFDDEKIRLSHIKAFLKTYKNIKSLWLESNGITKITNNKANNDEVENQEYHIKQEGCDLSNCNFTFQN
jgi:hypothetical protein